MGGGDGGGVWVGGVGKLPCRGYKRASSDKLSDRIYTERIFWVGGIRAAYVFFVNTLTPSKNIINKIFKTCHQR